MKNNLRSLARTAAFASALLIPASVVLAAGPDSADRAATLLARHGSVPVENAGPFVEIGTFRIQVAVKLGEPSAKLADGTWLYPGFRIKDGDTAGTLVVRFDQGRVSELSLVTPGVAAAMTARSALAGRVAAAGRR